MWFDEILVPLTARFPVDYIVQRSIISDVHPPYFALLIKAMLCIGNSETLLRLPSALAGIAGVYLTYRIGRALFSANCGLLAAALLAVNPLHILLSRQVRPYSLLLAAILLSLYFLARLVTRFTLRDAVWFSLANLAIYCLHFVSFLVIGTELLLFLLLSLWPPRRVSPATAANVVLANIALCAPTLIFFLNRRSEIGKPAPLADTLVLASGKSLDAVFGNAPTGLLLAGACAIVLGAVALCRRNPRLGAQLVLSIAIPLAALVAVGYNSYFNPWHIFFLVPPTLYLAACGIAAVAGDHALVPAVLCLAASVAIFHTDFGRYYEETSYSDYSRAAAILRDHTAPGDTLVFPNALWHHSAAWYYDTTTRTLPVPQVSSDRQCTPVVLAWTESGFGDLAGSAEALRASHGTPETLYADNKLALYRYCIAKQGPIAIPALPGDLDLAFSVFELHAKADALQNVMADPESGGRVITVANDTPGFFEYRFTATGNQYPTHSIFILEYDNTGRDNQLVVRHAFDDEPEVLSFASRGPDPRHAVPIHIVRTTPFRELRLRIEMTSAPKTPEYLGGNLRTLAIRHVRAFFQCPAAMPAASPRGQEP